MGGQLELRHRRFARGGVLKFAIICSILGVLGPVSGALVHNLGSVLVVLNGALLYDRKL